MTYKFTVMDGSRLLFTQSMTSPPIVPPKDSKVVIRGEEYVVLGHTLLLGESYQDLTVKVYTPRTYTSQELMR